MNRSIRSLVVLLVLGAAVILALLPAGYVGQNQRGLIASLVDPSIALARIRRISDVGLPDPTLELYARGRKVLVVGLIACDPGELFRVQVTVTQLATDESDGALAEGNTLGFCTGDIQEWVVEAKARGFTVFEAGGKEVGKGKVCVAATTQGRGPINDAYQWCRDDVLFVVP